MMKLKIETLSPNDILKLKSSLKLADLCSNYLLRTYYLLSQSFVCIMHIRMFYSLLSVVLAQDNNPSEEAN